MYRPGRQESGSNQAAKVLLVLKDFAEHREEAHLRLIAALIEARSCERFRVLSEHIQDAELAKFYAELMISEANHYTTFLGYARKYGKASVVETRWKE